MTTKLAILAALVLVVAACGGDDGATVRNLGADGTATGTGTGTATGTGAATGTGTGIGGVAPACPSAEPTPGGATVAVTLTEYAIATDVDEVPAGSVRFVVENAGEEPHELLVLRAASLDELPLDDRGVLVEDRLPGGVLVGEIEPFAAGQTCELALELGAGDYLLVCNVVEGEGGVVKAHLPLGMVRSLTVTG